MAAPAPRSASCTGEEQHITISPATSNRGVEFKQDFHQVFRASTLQAAFEQHPAFTSVFTSKRDLQRRSEFGSSSSSSSSSSKEAKKYTGQIVALSTETSATTTPNVLRVRRKLLREKIDRLLDFEVDGNPEGKVMEIWVGYLRKVCDGFVESAERPGSPETLEFWDKVLSHVSRGSGMNYTTGWISAFTCFNSDGIFLGKDVPKDADFPLIPSRAVCHNVVSCPVKIDDNGKKYAGTLFSGQTVYTGEIVEDKEVKAAFEQQLELRQSEGCHSWEWERRCPPSATILLASTRAGRGCAAAGCVAVDGVAKAAAVLAGEGADPSIHPASLDDARDPLTSDTHE
eukprot:g19339.t1